MGKKIYILLGIVLLALLLRVFALDSNPPSLHADEADTGYTAYSLIKTLHDPYGNLLPLHFQGQANIYRAPLYTYLTTIPVYLLGLNVFSIRIASALLGVIFVGIVYLLARRLSNNDQIGLVASFLAAINPWSVLISRTGLEVNLCAVLLVGAVTAFFHHEKSKWFILLSSILFGLSIYSYHAAKIVAPLLILLLIILYWKKLLSIRLVMLISAIIFVLMYSTMLSLAIFGEGAKEFNNVNIFDNAKAVRVVDDERTHTLAPLNISSIYSNKPSYYLREISNKYFAPISFNYLFLNGESNLDKGLGNYGEYHIFESILLFLGLVYLINKKKKILLFIMGWFLIGILPGSITETGYYTYRDVTILPIISIIGAIGLYENRKFFTNKKILVPSLILFCIIFSNYLYTAFATYPYVSRNWWGYSQKEALTFAHAKKGDYKEVFIDGGFDWVILYAVYTNMEPKKLQNAYVNRKKVGNSLITKIDNISIGNFYDPSKSFEQTFIVKDSLIILPANYKVTEPSLKTFFAPDGGANNKVYEVK